MRTRLVLGAGGVLVAAYGAYRLLQLDPADLLDAVIWLAAGVLVHDVVLAPLTIAVTVLLARTLPVRLQGRVLVALVVLGTVTVTAVPVLGRFGARADNPTLLDRDYLVGWVLLAALVLVATAAARPLVRLLRGRDRTREGTRSAGQ